MSKVCTNSDCERPGREYDDSKITCPFCEQMLISSSETNDCSSENAQIEEITLIDINRKAIQIPLEGCIIGRSSGLGNGIFNSPIISDPHCRIFIENGTVYIEDIGERPEGSRNGTYVSSKERIPKYIPTPLFQNATLTIAKSQFRVEIKSTQVQNPACIEETLIWTVICPECGKWHKVDDSSKRITNCDGCNDHDYAKEIAKVKAVQRSETDWKSRE